MSDPSLDPEFKEKKSSKYRTLLRQMQKLQY